MASLVYMTCGDWDEAMNLARQLLSRKLCAGINVIPGAASLYWWQGHIREKAECLLIAQVGDDTLEEFMAQAANAHSYEVPCIVGLPIAGGHRAFLDWIEQVGGAWPCAWR